MSMPWFRLWTDVRTDAKLRSLTDSEYRTFINLLCLAAEQDDRGTVKGKSFALLAVEAGNGDPEAFMAAVDRLISLGIVTCNARNADVTRVTPCNADVTPCNAPGALHRVTGALHASEIVDISFVNFAKRQYTNGFAKPSDAPERVAERVRKYREKKRLEKEREENVDRPKRTKKAKADVTPVTRNVTPDVTPVTRNVTRCNADVTPVTPDTDTEEDVVYIKTLTRLIDDGEKATETTVEDAGKMVAIAAGLDDEPDPATNAYGFFAHRFKAKVGFSPKPTHVAGAAKNAKLLVGRVGPDVYRRAIDTFLGDPWYEGHGGLSWDRFYALFDSLATKKPADAVLPVKRLTPTEERIEREKAASRDFMDRMATGQYTDEQARIAAGMAYRNGRNGLR